MVRLMTGVAVGPNELNINSFVLTRRGEFVANTPESPRLLCCEIGMLDVWVHICFTRFWNMCPLICSPKMNLIFKSLGFAKMSKEYISLDKKMCMDSMELLKPPWEPQNAKCLKIAGHGTLGGPRGWIHGLPIGPTGGGTYSSP